MVTHWRYNFNPVAPDPHSLDIEDIAHCLARESRFAGAYDWEWYSCPASTILSPGSSNCRPSYSVAEHLVFVSRLAFQLARQAGHSLSDCRRIALAGLLHDGMEAYFKDLPAPLKHLAELSEYRELEERALEVLFRKFNCAVSRKEYCIIEEADIELRHIEAAQIFLPALAWARPRVNLKLQGWFPSVAKKLFINRFFALSEVPSEAEPGGLRQFVPLPDCDGVSLPGA
jgi:hypothetical protein